MRIGILGGSFNPAHEGHLHISNMALKSLKLDAIWWLVTPHNPLKPRKGLPTIPERMELCNQIVNNHPKIVVTGIEKELNTTYSYATVNRLNIYFPHTNFAWITGMDNAHSLHLWNEWQNLLDEICMVHITRQPPVKLVKQCPARMLTTQKHMVINRGGKYPLDSRTTYWLLQKRMINISSTNIRNNYLNTI